MVASDNVGAALYAAFAAFDGFRDGPLYALAVSDYDFGDADDFRDDDLRVDYERARNAIEASGNLTALNVFDAVIDAI